MNATTIGTKNVGGNVVSPRSPSSRRHRRDHRSRRTTQTERYAIYAVAVAAGLAAVFSSAQPAAYAWASALWRFAFVAGVTLAASRARRWTWLVLGGLAVVGATEAWWVMLAGAGVMVGVVATFLPRRRLPGAISVALSLQALVRLPEIGPAGGSVALLAAAVAPVLGSAYLVSPRRVRRRIHRALLGAGAVVLVGAVVLAISSFVAYSATNRATAKARDGLQAVRAGRTTDAAVLLNEASEQFGQAHGALTAPWAQLTMMVPLVAQQADAMATATAQGERVAAAAAQAAHRVDYEALKYRNGQIDVAKIRDAEEPLTRTAQEMVAAAHEIDQLRSPWLAGPIAAKLDEFDQELRRSAPEAETAAMAARQAPALLGADGVRRYLVLFTTPAEERGLGGFVGGWAVLTADQGQLEMTAHGRAHDINTANGPRDLAGPDDYVQRYGRFRPQDYFQDITLSPDLASVAEVARSVYGQRTGPGLGGPPVDGVLVVDPFGLAALLHFTGPVAVDGLSEPLTADNAVDVLLRRQYLELGTNTERRDAIDEAGRLTFDKLVHSDLPSPGRIADVLAPVVADKHIMFHSFTEADNDLFARVGADGRFPTPSGGDLVSVRTQNGANNKADIFLKRRIEYRPKFNPATGATEATVKVTMTNEAPSSGLPAAFIGSNDRDLPPGANRMYFSLYSPLGLRRAAVNGQEQGFEFQKELGWSVYSQFLTIAPGDTVTVEMELFGTLSTQAYRLEVPAQPMVNPDQFLVEMEPASGWAVATATAVGTGGFAVESGGGRAVMAAPLTTDLDLRATFKPR